MWYRSFLLLAFGISAAVIIGCGDSASDTVKNDTARILPVETLRTMNQQEFSYPLTFYGRIQAARRSSLSFETPGQVASLMANEGENIEADQPMAQLNTAILDAEMQRLLASKKVEQTLLRRLQNGEREEVIEAARAVVSRMEAENERATLDRDRIKKLHVRDATTESEYDKALYEAKSLQASVAEARARLKELETGTREEDIEAQENRIAELDAQVAILNTRIAKATLLAPFKVHVLRRLVDEGVVMQAGEPVFVVTEVGSHEARFFLPINQLDNARAATSISAGDAVVLIESVRVISTVSPETRTVDVVFELKDSAKVIDGESCTLTLSETVKTPCVEITVSALVPSVRGLWSCYRLEKDEKVDAYRVMREEITINHTDGDRVFIETSLPDGSVIVRTGVHKLVPGMLVRPKDEP